jgi:hypothetical protein
MKLLVLVLAIAACSGGDDAAGAAKPSGSAAKRGSGLSASLTTDFAKEQPAAGSQTPTPPTPIDSGNGTSGSSSSSSGSGVKSGSAEPPVVATKPIDAGVAKTAIDAGATPAVVQQPPPVKLTPELAAIKFELLPNWERDKAGAATFSLDVTVPKTGAKTTFTFRYGYDVPNAPTDREQYKKLLADQGLLTVTLDRQRGPAWYLEGTDGNGARAFRFVVTYGGKRLVCFGSAYHDTEHDPLGDLRDEVLIQAKKICESLSL